MGSSGVMSLTCPSVCACVCAFVCAAYGHAIGGILRLSSSPVFCRIQNAVSKDLRKEPQVTVARLSNFLSVKIWPVILIVVRGSRPRNPLLPAPSQSMPVDRVNDNSSCYRWSTCDKLMSDCCDLLTLMIPENVVVDVKYYCDVSHILIFHVTP